MPTLDATNVEKLDDVQGRPRSPVAGNYHGIVDRVAYNEANDADDINLRVLAGAPKSPDDGPQQGRVVWHRMFRRDGEFTDVHLRFALATGIIKLGQKSKPDWEQATGAQVVFTVVEVADKNDPSKIYARIGDAGCAIWPVTHPNVASVPKDAAHLQLLGSPQAAAAATAETGDPQDGWANI